MTVYLIEAKEQPLSPGRAGWFSYQTKTDMYGALVLCLKNAYSCCMNLKGQPINRLNDVLMKYVFAREDQKAVTLSLINAVFAAENYALLEDFQFLDRELDPSHPEDKEVRLDILGRSSDGTSVNVEVQVDSFKWMTKRLLYYWARRYALKRGETYGKLARTVSIVILNYVLFPELPHDYHHAFAFPFSYTFYIFSFKHNISMLII